MAKTKRKVIDPLTKRPDETDLQWRARLARAQETRRKAGEDIITPERMAKGDLEEFNAKVQGVHRSYRQRSTSSLARLCVRGVLTSDQLAAAQEIATIIHSIGAEVGYASGSIEARVDCSSSAKSHGADHLHRVCMERAYTKWRSALPHPKGMVLDMLTEDHRLAAIAARYGRNWRVAIGTLKDALDDWPEHRQRAFKDITQDDVDRSNERAA